MRYLIVLLVLLSGIVSGQNTMASKETLSLTATASTAADTTRAFRIGDRTGSITLFCDATVNSGTATAITITYQLQPQGDATNWFAVNGGTSNSVGVISAAQLAADDEVYFVLSDLTSWTWGDNIRFIATAASGTFNVDLILMVEGS